MTDVPAPVMLLLGANGQIGWELRHSLAPIGTVIAPDRGALDLTDLAALRRAIDAAAPDVIVNAAAYTQVDRAETEPDVAHRINAEVPAALGRAAKESGSVVVHYSTDYVFDGSAHLPYRESDATHPVNVYGRSKLAGDVALLESGAAACIFRVAWVYGQRGRNFLRTIQRLAAEGKELRVVADQRGGPTWCRAIAEATAAALAAVLGARAAGNPRPSTGVYHMGPPDNTTWADFARAIVETLPAGVRRPTVTGIATADYPTPAQRPAWSVLDPALLRETFGVTLPPWREQLAACVASEPKAAP